MDTNQTIGFVICMFFFTGWIPILAVGSVIKGCIKARKCNQCTCNNCNKEVNHES